MGGSFLLLSSNPFFQSYARSDLFGKGIFLMLFILSIVSWALLVYKGKVLNKTRRISRDFQTAFEKKKQSPLSVAYKKQTLSSDIGNSFHEIYLALKTHTLDILSKNKSGVGEGEHTYLSTPDIDLVSSHIMSTIANQAKMLEKNLYILATTISLAPFLGLLGTVWGILITFSELQAYGFAQTNEAVLGGLSMALATTVLGLLVAIPALIGYNYFKSAIRDFEKEMEHFSTVMLTAVELQYRKIDT